MSCRGTRELVGVEQTDHLAEKVFVGGIERRERFLAFLGQLHMTHPSVCIVLDAGDQALGGEPVDEAAGRGRGRAEHCGEFVHGHAFGPGGGDEDVQLPHRQVRRERHGAGELEALKPDLLVELQDLASERRTCRLRHVLSPPPGSLISLV